MNYYNDNDPFVCKWLKELIKAKLIPDGEVDDRSIAEIRPKDLRGFKQCHFFAGISGWSLALRLAGWPDGKRVFTGSCPCQPFSVAGKGGGIADDRHLWPAFRWLIAQCQPSIVFGEQVASSDGRKWLDGVSSDLEIMGYEVGASDLPAASVGAPHKRNRLFWVANATYTAGTRQRQQRINLSGETGYNFTARPKEIVRALATFPTGRLANSNGQRQQGQSVRLHRQSRNGKTRQEIIEAARTSPTGRVADSELQNNGRRIQRPQKSNSPMERYAQEQRSVRSVPTNFWSNSVLIPCADGKYRRVPGRVAESDGGNTGAKGLQRSREHGQQPSNDSSAGRWEIEPALFPLADGFCNRVGTLRGAGNAIVPQVAAEFIKAFMDCEQHQQAGEI